MSRCSANYQQAVVLHCTAIVYLVVAFFSATFGAVQPGSAWFTQAAYGVAGLATIYGAVKGGSILYRDLRRRQFIRDSVPRIYDMASYLGGHPGLARPCRVLVLLTDTALILDAGKVRVAVPLSRTRLAHRQAGNVHKGQAWLVAQNRFDQRTLDALDLEFLDAQGFPQRLTLARFRRTTVEQWSEALAAAVRDVAIPTADEGAAALR